jgi:NADPH-dependent curcumin reductase CurA
VVGVAGSAAKCRDVVERYGFETCLDHRATDFADQLETACARGIDVYWENVGGHVLEAVLPLLNDFARIPVCGLVAWYNATGLPRGPDRLPSLMRLVLARRLHLQGFIVSDRPVGDFHDEVGKLVREGRVHYREDIRDGLEHAPAALIGLLDGDNMGKLLIRLAPDPTR